MNILIVCNSYPTAKNPHSQIFIKNMKENLEKDENINVDVCYNRIFDYWKGASKKKDVFSNLMKYAVFILSIFFYVIRNRKKIDVLFPQAVVFPTVFSGLLKKIYQIPMVCYIHGGDVNTYPKASTIYKLLMKNALEKCNSVIVNSRDLRDKVMNIFPHDKVEIISPGVNTAVMKRLNKKKELRDEFNLPQDKVILLTVGDAIKRKGHDILLKSLAYIDSEVINNIFVLIITEGPERPKLQHYINTHNLVSRVRIDNKVNQQALNKYYNASDIFVFPSREEPLGLVGLEAMAAGIPVIASRVGGIPDYVKNKENGLLFKSENPASLASKITELVSSKTLYKELRNNADVYPRKYSVTQAAKRINDIFYELASKNKKMSTD